MEYPHDLPRHLRPSVDATIAGAAAEFGAARRQMSRAELCMRAANYVQVVVAASADSACQAVREGAWEAERVRFEMNALSQGGFVRRLIVGAYYDLELRDAWGSLETYLEEVTSNLKRSEHWLRYLENLREAAELQRASRGSATTAKNVTWDDVIVAFTSDERVQISAKVGGGTFNYTEFGLEDQRDGTPVRLGRPFENSPKATAS